MSSHERTLTIKVRYRTPEVPRRPFGCSRDGAFVEEIMHAARAALAPIDAVESVDVHDDRETVR